MMGICQLGLVTKIPV